MFVLLQGAFRLTTLSQRMQTYINELQVARKTVASLEAAQLEFSVKVTMLESELVFKKGKLQEVENANASLRSANDELNVRMTHLSTQVLKAQKEATAAAEAVAGADEAQDIGMQAGFKIFR